MARPETLIFHTYIIFSSAQPLLFYLTGKSIKIIPFDIIVMNPNELEPNDFVEVFSPNQNQTQLAKIISIDQLQMKAELLLQNEKNTIRISSPDQWKIIHPHFIYSQDLHAIGFHESSIEISYGWTATEWIKKSLNQKYLFHLWYENSAWSIEITCLIGMMYRSSIVEGIKYFHSLQHILNQYQD